MSHRDDDLMALSDGPDWRERAACRGMFGVFYSSDSDNLKLAAETCGSCPVITECDQAAEGEPDGFWAGRPRGRMNGERVAQCLGCDNEFVPPNRSGRVPRWCPDCEALRLAAPAKRVGRPAGTTAMHGTRSRYAYGCRCDECRQAEREYSRERRSGRRKGPFSVTCPVCGIEWWSPQRNHVVCGEECRDVYVRRRQAEYRAARREAA